MKAEGDPAAALPALLCLDVTMISLLLGLAPTGHLVGYTTDVVEQKRLQGLHSQVCPDNRANNTHISPRTSKLW